MPLVEVASLPCSTPLLQPWCLLDTDPQVEKTTLYMYMRITVRVADICYLISYVPYMYMYFLEIPSPLKFWPRGEWYPMYV